MVEVSIDTEHDLTTFNCSENLTEQEILNEIHAFYRGHITKHTIWHLGSSSSNSISTSAFRTIFETIHSLKDPRRGGRTAIVASKDLEYGLGRMMQTWADIDEFPYEIEVFRILEEAREWLLPKE